MNSIKLLSPDKQSKVDELEKWEEQEVERAMTTLMEEDRLWERKKKGERSETSRSYTVSLGGKRGGDREQAGTGRRRKNLKFDLLEDDWGQEKTTENEGGVHAIGEQREGAEEPREEPDPVLPGVVQGWCGSSVPHQPE